MLAERSEVPSFVKSEEAEIVNGAPSQKSSNAAAASEQSPAANTKTDPMGPYPFDRYQGRLYRIFEGTVFEGVVTNHIDGGFNGPILVMLTTDYYSHDHQQLLMPQGTRLIGTVQSVGSSQQRKMFVTFHRAVCPDGFSLDFDKYIGLDPLGTTGLATKVDHGYFQAFAAAAAIGGIGGLAQIGNNGSVLDPSTEIRNGISEQMASEGEQILNHFLNRLPVICAAAQGRRRELLHSRFHQVAVSALGHPARASQVAVMDGFGALGLARRIETEDDHHDFTPIGALRVSVEQAQIGHEVLLVIGVHALGHGWPILESLYAHFQPHECRAEDFSRIYYRFCGV